jgi:hypothetical protein
VHNACSRWALNFRSYSLSLIWRRPGTVHMLVNVVTRPLSHIPWRNRRGHLAQALVGMLAETQKRTSQASNNQRDCQDRGLTFGLTCCEIEHTMEEDCIERQTQNLSHVSLIGRIAEPKGVKTYRLGRSLQKIASTILRGILSVEHRDPWSRCGSPLAALIVGCQSTYVLINATLTLLRPLGAEGSLKISSWNLAPIRRRAA